MPVHVQIVTNRAMVFDDMVDQVLAPGFLGEFGVLPGHEQYLTLVRPGRVVVFRGETQQAWIVGTGFAEAGPDHLTILCDYCEPLSAYNKEKSLAALQSADGILAHSADGSVEWIKAEREAGIARAWLGAGG
jgi:F-type H+-transporting ATPase subunit epsilon